MITINGITLPVPSQFDFSTEDVDAEAFRTTDGLMHRQRMGSKIKLTVTWNALPGSVEFAELVRLLDNLPEFFTLQFPHPIGGTKTITAYRGNPLSVSMRRYLSDGQMALWQNLKVSFIER